MKTMLLVLAVFLLTGGIVNAGDDSYVIAAYHATTTENVYVYGPLPTTTNCDAARLNVFREVQQSKVAPSLVEIGYRCASRDQIAKLNLNPPICELVDSTAYESGGSFWLYVCYRGTVDRFLAPSPPPPTTAELEQQHEAKEAAQAAQRQAAGYASYICHVIQGCEQIVPTTIYPTKAKCQFAGMSDPNFVPGNSAVWHECRTVQAQFASSSQSSPPAAVPSSGTVNAAPAAPTAPQPALDDITAAVKSINPDAALKIQSYCTKAAAGNANLKSCEQREVDAWDRVVLHREFPEHDYALDSKCSEPPFLADSFVAYEACLKYELRR